MDVTDQHREELHWRKTVDKFETPKISSWRNQELRKEVDVDVRRNCRLIAGSAGRAFTCRQGCPDGFHRSHHGRDGHWKGTRRACHPQALAAIGSGVRFR